MGNNKFKFSDMIPNAWFYKLKDMSKTRSKQQRSSTTTATKKKLIAQATISQPKHTKKDNKKKAQKFKTEIPTTIISSSDNYKFPPPKHSSRPPSENMIRFPEAPLRKSTKGRISTSRRKAPFPKPVINSRSFFLSSSESSSSETDFPDSINNNPSEFDSELDLPIPSWPSSCNCRLSTSTADIIIDLNDKDKDKKFGSAGKKTATNDRVFDVVSEMIDLPPILTKPMNFDDPIFEATKHKSSSSRPRRIKDEEQKTTNNSNSSSGRKSLSGNVSSGIRLRTNSPRLASKKIQAYARKSVSSRNKHLSESLAVVTSSVDPQRDFRDSMVEMIVENNIRASKDLEELLACYLSLNSKQYHDVIVKAFEQIWFDMADIRD